jgi:sulfonate transport system substrate-binding protein
MIKRAIVFAVLIASGFGATSAEAADVVLRIGYLRLSDAMNVMRIQGTLERALAPLNVKVEWKGPFGAFAPAAEALNANAIDVSVGSSSSALTAIVGDAPISLLGYVWDTGQDTGLVVKKNSPIYSISDLVGKKVAVNRAGTGEYLLSRALEKAGIPIDKIKKAYLSPPDSAAAFMQDKVDAWAAWGSFYPIALVELDARILAKSSSFDSENALVYVVRTDFAKNNPKVMGILMATMREANAWSQNNTREMIPILMKDLKISYAAAELLASYRHAPAVPIRNKEKISLEHQNDWLVEQKILKQKPDLDRHVVTDFGEILKD